MLNEILLRQAARLRTMVAIDRARFQACAAATYTQMPKQELPGMQPETHSEPEADDEARTVAAELLKRIALDASGAPFNDDEPEMWGEADATIPEVVSLGEVRFRIMHADAVDLAVAAGVIEPGDTTLCLRVEFDAHDGAPAPAMGQVVAVPTEEPGVSLAFEIWLTHDDLADPAAPKLGPDTERNPALDLLEPGQALLVQVLNSEKA